VANIPNSKKFLLLHIMSQSKISS